MKSPLLARLLTFSAYGLFAVALAPLLALSHFNHPSAADDYCFADTATRFGFWQAQQFYYNGWTGRYFSNFLVHGSPLVWGWYEGYKLIPALVAIGWVGAAYLFVRELLRGLVPAGSVQRVALLLTGLLFFVYMLQLPTVVEAFVWLASVTVYTVPTILMLYWAVVVVRWCQQPPGWLRTLTGIWAAVLIFLIVGCGETHMLLLISLLLAILAYQRVAQRRIDGRLASLLVVALVSAWLVIRAPGNAVRMNGGATAGDLPGGLVLSINWLAQHVPGWFGTTPLLPLSALWLLVGANYLTRGGRLAAFVRVPGWYVGLVLAGLLLATVLPSFYATGFITDRAVNVTYAVFLVGWLYLLTSLLPHIHLPTRETAVTGVILFFCAILTQGTLRRNQPLKQLYGDLLSGKAAAYDREMTSRRQRLLAHAAADTLHLPPLTTYPASLFVEDMRDNPAHWWNRCQAGYYHYKAIVIDSTAHAPHP